MLSDRIQMKDNTHIKGRKLFPLTQEEYKRSSRLSPVTSLLLLSWQGCAALNCETCARFSKREDSRWNWTFLFSSSLWCRGLSSHMQVRWVYAAPPGGPGWPHTVGITCACRKWSDRRGFVPVRVWSAGMNAVYRLWKIGFSFASYWP